MTNDTILTPEISSANIPAMTDAQTMSSREIAALTGKTHKNIIRDIEVMILDIEKDGSNLIHQAKSMGYVRHKDARGYTSSIDLTRDLTYNLVLGYDAVRRLRVVQRWIELEGAGQKSAFTIPKNLSEALRLAADQAEQIEVMKPVVAAYNRLAKAQGSVCLTDAAKMCQMKPQAFIRYLNAEHWIYRRVGSPAWIGYAEHLDNGDLEHKYTTVQRDDGTEKITTQARVTAQGVTKLCLKLGIPAPAFDKQEAAHATV